VVVSSTPSASRLISPRDIFGPYFGPTDARALPSKPLCSGSVGILCVTTLSPFPLRWRSHRRYLLLTSPFFSLRFGWSTFFSVRPPPHVLLCSRVFILSLFFFPIKQLFVSHSGDNRGESSTVLASIRCLFSRSLASYSSPHWAAGPPYLTEAQIPKFSCVVHS